MITTTSDSSYSALPTYTTIEFINSTSINSTFINSTFINATFINSAFAKPWLTNTTAKRQATALRPFGDASVDGFDLDFESTVRNMAPFGQTLRSLMDADTLKTYYLTAAPQCVYPDAADNEMLNGAVSFDAIFVQFYNNFCGLQSFLPNMGSQTNFNFETWDTWAKTTSGNPNVKVFVGVPAGKSAAGSGYTSAAQIASIVEYCKGFSSFGGVMMWDASQAYANDGFLSGVRSALLTGRRK
jgi:chitinase